jgi:uncharacterized membrane protein YgcG
MLLMLGWVVHSDR